MANLPISGLPVASSLDGTELLPFVQGGVTTQATAQDILDANLPVTSSGITVSGDINVNGNSHFGTDLSNTHEFTGSLLVSGSIDTNIIGGRTIFGAADLGDQAPTVRINENFEVNHAEVLVNRQVTGTGTSFIRVEPITENFEFGRRASKNPNVDLVALAISTSGSISLARPDFDPWRAGANVVQVGENSSLVEIRSIFDGEKTLALPYNGYINQDGFVTHRKDGPISLMAIGESGSIYFRTAPSGSAGSTASRVDTNMTVSERLVQISGSLQVDNSLTASLQENYVWLGDSNNRNTQVSLDTLADSGSLIKKSYGSFYDTTTQSGSANTAYAMKHNTTDLSSDVSIVSDTRITMAEAGVYTIISTQQFKHTSGGTVYITGWIRKNGVDVANSATDLTLKGNGATELYAINYFVEAAAGDYFELIWSATDSSTEIVYQAARTSPTRPAVPSVITTVNRVG